LYYIAGFVKPLGREVSSRYAGDAFSQQRSPASGELFNVSYKYAVLNVSVTY